MNWYLVQMNRLLPLCFLILSVFVVFIVWYLQQLGSVVMYHQASAHFFGVPVLQNKTAGEYKIVFQPYPTVPTARDNSTKINLSILGKDDQNFNAVFASLIIKEKDTGHILKKFPYGFYEFSDMTYSYTFPKVGTYIVTLVSKINGDPIYAEKPLSVDFELPVGTANNYLTFTQTLAAYLTVAIGIIAAIIFYLRTKKN